MEWNEIDIADEELDEVDVDVDADVDLEVSEDEREDESENESEALRLLIELRPVVAAIGIEVKRLAGNGRAMRRRAV